MTKNGKKQNVVATTRKQNMAAAKVCETHNEAISLFRALQYANDMGTGEDDFDELAEHFINKQVRTHNPCLRRSVNKYFINKQFMNKHFINKHFVDNIHRSQTIIP